MTPAPVSHLRAFGLDATVAWALPRGTAVPVAHDPALPSVRVRRVDPDELDALWATPGDRIFEPPFTDGKVHFTVDRTRAGYRLWFDDFGRYAVSADGRELICDGSVDPERCDRFLFAQLLPLAAVLNGRDLLHASAVAPESGVAAFVGRSGVGKTTLAIRLMTRGVALMTDDVLAVELAGGQATAHPGPPFVALAEPDAVRAQSVPRLGPPVGRSDKLHLAPSVSERSAPLRAIYHLEPHPAFQIAAVAAEATDRVLANAFAPYVRTPERLMARLESSYVLSRTVPQFVLRLPPTGLPDDVLDELQAHMSELGL